MRRGKNFTRQVIFDRSHQSALATRGRKIDSTMKVVVVLPLVPVIPVIRSFSAGRP